MQLLNKNRDRQVVHEIIEVDEPEHSYSLRPQLTQVWVEELQGETKRLIAKWILI